MLPEVAGTLPRDLAECPGPTDTGFASPPLEGAALSALALTADEVERFDRDGFVATAQPVLSQSQLEQLRCDLDALCDQADPHPKLDLLNELHYNEAAGSGQVLFHCLGHWRCSAGIALLATGAHGGAPTSPNTAAFLRWQDQDPSFWRYYSGFCLYESR